MIGRRLIEGKPQEFLEGDTVIDLSFQFGVVINVKPLLNQKAFEQKQRWISVSTFGAFTNGMMFQKQAFDENGKIKLKGKPKL